MLERASLAVEKSAEAVLPAGILIAGKGRTRSRGQDASARGMDDQRSQPREGPGREGLTVKPEDLRAERSSSSAPGDTVPHPAEASLWEQFLSRGNLAERSDASSRTPVPLASTG